MTQFIIGESVHPWHTSTEVLSHSRLSTYTNVDFKMWICSIPRLFCSILKYFESVEVMHLNFHLIDATQLVEGSSCHISIANNWIFDWLVLEGCSYNAVTVKLSVNGPFHEGKHYTPNSTYSNLAWNKYYLSGYSPSNMFRPPQSNLTVPSVVQSPSTELWLVVTIAETWCCLATSTHPTYHTYSKRSKLKIHFIKA